MKTTGKKPRGKLRALGSVTAALILIAAGALLYMSRDQLLTDESSAGDAADRGAEPYTYESGASQVFAVFGDCLAIATTSGLQILDEDGYIITREYVTMKAPAIAGADWGAVFFDVGGTAVRVVSSEGEHVKLDSESKIVNVSANKSGSIAVVTEESGYRALVTVYNKNLDPVYEWYSGGARVLSAQISPNGREMAALCLGDDGASIVIFSLDREAPRAELSLPGELFIDMRYMSDGSLAAVSGERLLFIDARKGEERESFSFEGKNLMSYSLGGDGFVLLILGERRVGDTGEMISVGTDAAAINSLSLPQSVDSVRVLGKKIFVLSGGTLTQYSDSLEIKGEGDGFLGVRFALPRARGDCLLVTACTAELFSF